MPTAVPTDAFSVTEPPGAPFVSVGAEGATSDTLMVMSSVNFAPWASSTCTFTV